MSYKLLSFWYATPTKVKMWYPLSSDTLILAGCNNSRGDTLHIWWACPLLTPFWNAVCKTIERITGTDGTFSAAFCLFHVSKCPTRLPKLSLTGHLLTSAKLLIPRHWKSSHSPTVVKWLAVVEEIYNMEELAAISRDSIDKFNKQWSPWLIFRYSTSYTQLVTN